MRLQVVAAETCLASKCYKKIKFYHCEGYSVSNLNRIKLRIGLNLWVGKSSDCADMG